VYWIIVGLALWHTLFVVLLTIQITEDIRSTGFLVFLLIYNMTFTLYELPEMWLLKHNYLNDTWNLVDFSKVVFTNIYLIAELAGAIEEDDMDMRLILSLAVFLAWIRLIGFLRLVS
jgi:low temperature requirement protein LtrA